MLLQAVAVSVGEICRKFRSGENHLCSSSCCDMGGTPSKFAVIYAKRHEIVYLEFRSFGNMICQYQINYF